MCVDLDTEVTGPTQLNANPKEVIINWPHLCAVEILTSELLRRSDFDIWIVIYVIYFL
jgi:hypothetical protein